MLGFTFFTLGCSEKGAEDYLQEAAAYSAKDDPKAAVVALKNAVQVAPRSAIARFELGRINLALSNFEEASKELTRALEYGYSESKVIPPLAEALHRSSANVALADLDYDSSGLSAEEQLEVGARKISALIELDKREEASIIVEQLLEVNAETPYKGMVKGYQLIIAKDYLGALSTLEDVLETAPLNRDVIALAARLYILNGDIENAANLYENYVDIAKDDLQAKFALVNILMQQKQPERAEKYIDELLTINNTNGALNQLKATARAAVGDHEAAKEYAEKAINSGRSDYALRLVAGFSSYKIEDFESAIKHLSVVAGSLPDDHPALRMLADSQLRLNRGKDAALVLERVENISPNDVSLFSRTGYELIKAGDTESAKQIIKQAETVSESSDELLRLGVLKLTLNDLEGIVDLKSAVAKAPDSVSAKSTLAGAYLATNQLDKAMALAKQWQQENPDAVEGYLLEADVLSSQEKFDESAKVVARAASIDADNSLVQLASIRVDIIAEKYEQALPKIEALVAKEPSNIKALVSYFKVTSELGDADVAVATIEDAAKNNPSDQALTILFASTLVSDKKFSEALNELKRIHASRLTPSSYWGLKGIALYNTSNLPDSRKHYSQWADFFPNQVEPTLGLLNILDLQSDYTKGVTVATNYLAKNKNLQIQVMQAYFFAMSKDAKNAAQTLSKLADEYQALPFVRGIKARIALLEGRAEEGVADASAAYLAKKSAQNLLLYVLTLDSAGKSAEGFEIIEQHVNDFPNDIRSKALLAERKVASDSSAALASYEEMLKDYPENPIFLNNAGYLHFKANNFEKAYEYSAKAYELVPQNVAFTDTYAQILMQRGETEKAVTAYNAVISDSIVDEEIILNYIEALFRNKNILAAKRRIREFNSKLKTQDSKDRLLDLQIKYSN